MKDSLRLTWRALKMMVWVIRTLWAAWRGGAFKQTRQPHHRGLINWACQSWADAIDVNIKVHNTIPDTQGLWVANHVSWVDGPVFGSVAPAYFVGKAEIANWPVVGKIVAAGGTFFVKRGSGDSGSVASQMAELLKTGESIIFFPEATTTDGRRVYKIHSKLLQAAVEANVPVQPLVALYQARDGSLCSTVPWHGGESFMQHFTGVLKQPAGTAHVMACAPVSSDGHDKESLRDAVQAVMNAQFNVLHKTVFGVEVDPSIAEDRKRPT